MSDRISTGIQGLDNILYGGLLPQRVYLISGEPGSGKTTLGLHFLAAGAAAGERTSMITFGQPADNIRADASSVGLEIGPVKILDLTPPPEAFSEFQMYDIFSPAEVERGPMTSQIVEAIRDGRPHRIFADAFGQFRALISDPFQHRRLAQSFFHFATRHGATLIVASESTESAQDADGVIQLACNGEGRTLRILKYRGSDFHDGRHPMRLSNTGFEVPLTAA